MRRFVLTAQLIGERTSAGLHCAAYGLFIGFSIMASTAAVADVQSTVASLQSHPRVLSERAKGLASKARISELRAQWLPSVSVGTDGGTRIFGSTSKSQSRAFGDNDFVDVLVTGRQLLYDFGSTDSFIDESKYLSQADAQLGDIVFNELVGELVQFSIQYKAEQRRLELIQQILVPLEVQYGLAERRYLTGVSSGEDYRRIGLDKDALKSDMIESQRLITDVSRRVVEQFAFNVEEALELSQLLLDNAAKPGAEERLSDVARRYREQGAMALIEAISAQRMPRIELELEGRTFDIGSNGISENELIGNIRVKFPFFDGGATAAKVKAAKSQRNALHQELIFQQRVLAERSAQIDEELVALDKLLFSLKNQIQTEQETLAMANARQGRTAIEINEISSNLMSLYRLKSVRINTELRVQKLQADTASLYEQWPSRVSDVLSGFK